MVCKNKDDLPTSLKPPKDVKRVHSLSNVISRCIRFPRSCNIFFRSLLFFLNVLLILCMISEAIGGVLSILGAHPIVLTISLEVAPYLPITKPGLRASIITSQETSSK